jgi:predicted DNA-binding transcriptional regulator AlpA
LNFLSFSRVLKPKKPSTRRIAAKPNPPGPQSSRPVCNPKEFQMQSRSRVPRGKKTEIEEMISVAEICKALGISTRTFYEWRAKGLAPECIKLPNGSLRVEPAEYDRWLKTLKKSAA